MCGKVGQPCPIVEERRRLALWSKAACCLRRQHDSKGKLMDSKGQSSSRFESYLGINAVVLWGMKQ